MRKLLYIFISAALYWPATAAAQHHAHRAQTPTQLIQREVGPGTVVESCWPIHLGVRCDYSTPGRNIGVIGEPDEVTWNSWADVIRGRVFLTI